MVLYFVEAWLNPFFYIIHKVYHDSFCRRRVRLLNSFLQSRQCHAILFPQKFGNAAEKLNCHIVTRLISHKCNAIIQVMYSSRLLDRHLHGYDRPLGRTAVPVKRGNIIYEIISFRPNLFSAFHV